jgi:hypothetical protein
MSGGFNPMVNGNQGFLSGALAAWESVVGLVAAVGSALGSDRFRSGASCLKEPL